MRKMIFFLFAALVLVSSDDAAAKAPKNATIERLSQVTKIFVNQNCKENDTCDLKEARLVLKKYRIWVGGSLGSWHYGTSAVTSYQTSAVDNLENYSFVQFIRGCMFDTYKDEDKSIEKILGHRKVQFAEFDEKGEPKDSKMFCFPDWIIDSMDKDPVYFSFPEYGRFYARRWNTILGSYEKATEKYYGEEKPTHPVLYVKDSPTSAFLFEDVAINTSLEFKTCIYKTKDVPAETTEDNINFAEPIKCFEWQHIYIYNYETKDFETKSEIDPFCLEKPSE